MYLEAKNISLTFKTNKGSFKALDNVSFCAEKGEFVCIIGPSGCGKSTLLNTVAGFIRPDAGEVTINGENVTSPDIRRVMIFQDYGLLPWRTAEKQVQLGLESMGVGKKERKEISDKYLDMVGLSGFKDARPGELSGGQRQRVAIARALAVDPDVIYMDEPFGALDAITRMRLQDDFRKLGRKEEKTILFVTHDIEEAVYLADMIVVMEPDPGHIKGIINVGMGNERDRTSDEFLKARDKVFEVFNLKSGRNIEYYI